MSSLAAVVRGLAARDGIDAVVVASGDGLPIDHAGSAGLDAEALAALAATLARQAGRLADAAGRGEATTIVLECEAGMIVAAMAGEGNWLLLLVAPETNIGPLLYDLRRHRPALGALL